MYFLVLQHTYTHVEAAVFRELLPLERITLPKTEASASLMPALQTLLHNNSLTWSSLSFIAANQGPGPFTTMRVVIATVNGISFATSLPLIGIDGLATLLDEHKDNRFPLTLAILNAFNHDAYYGLATPQGRTTGVMNSVKLLAMVAEKFPQQTIRCLGQGVSVFRREIESTFGARALIQDPLSEQCSLQALANHAIGRWAAQESLSTQLLPLYLKQQTSSGSTVLFQ